MRIVIQRCVKASVEVAGETVGSIGQGLMALIGIERNDTWIECEYCLRRLINGRYFDADPVLSEATRASGTREQVATKAWAKSVKDMDLEILIVSQFTLYGRLTKGSKPDFHKAMKAPQSEEMFNKCVQWVKDNYKPEKVQTGAFGRYMRNTGHPHQTWHCSMLSLFVFLLPLFCCISHRRSIHAFIDHAFIDNTSSVYTDGYTAACRRAFAGQGHDDLHGFKFTDIVVEVSLTNDGPVTIVLEQSAPEESTP